MINSNPSSRLIKHIIRSYARLAENSRVRAILRENLPSILKDKNFFQSLEESSRKWLQNLLKSLSNISSNNNNNDRSTMQLISGLNSGNINGINNMSNIGNLINNQNMNVNNSNSFMMNPNDNMGYNNYSNNYNEYMEGNGKGNMGYIMNAGNSSSSSKNYLNLNSNVFTYKNGK